MQKMYSFVWVSLAVVDIFKENNQKTEVLSGRANYIASGIILDDPIRSRMRKPITGFPEPTAGSNIYIFVGSFEKYTVANLYHQNYK